MEVNFFTHFTNSIKEDISFNWKSWTLIEKMYFILKIIRFTYNILIQQECSYNAQFQSLICDNLIL